MKPNNLRYKKTMKSFKEMAHKPKGSSENKQNIKYVH